MGPKDAFDKVADYINAELESSKKDYELIVELNGEVKKSFGEYIGVAEKISKNVNKINENQEAKARLEGLIQAIDEMDKKVLSLEALAYKIDAYSKRLEENFRRLEPQSTV